MKDSIIKIIATRAKNSPKKIAIFCDGHIRYYNELLSNITYYADLISTNLSLEIQQPNEKYYTGILLENSIESLEVFFGAVASISIPVIYNHDWSPNQLQLLFNIQRPHLLIIHESLIEKFSSCLKLINYVVLKNTALFDQSLLDNRALEVNDKNILFIGFTSGTTSVPKGFIRTQKSWLKSFQASTNEFGINANSIISAPGQLAHGLSFYAAIEGLVNGASIHIQKKFDAWSLINFLNCHDNVALTVAPAMLKQIITQNAELNITLNKKITIITSAEKLNSQTSEKVKDVCPNSKIIEYYGASELGFISIRHVDNDHCSNSSVGKAFTGVEVTIMNENNVQLPCENLGEIWVKSDFLMDDYLFADHVSNYQRNGPWATVGDLGYIDKMGCIHVIGRKGDMIITGGYNVYPSEVENALKILPNVEEVYVFDLPDAKWGMAVCAAFKMATGGCVSKRMIQDVCSGVLTRYKLPKRLFLISTIPLTTSGKTSRKMIKEKVLHNDPSICEILI